MARKVFNFQCIKRFSNKSSALDIRKSDDAIRLLNNIRWAYFKECHHLNSNKQQAIALILLRERESKLDTAKLPYSIKKLEEAMGQLKKDLSPVKQ